MTRIKLFLLNIMLIIMTVPWFSNDMKIRSIFGVPSWALYTLSSTFIYAVCIYYFLNQYWSVSASNKTLEK